MRRRYEKEHAWYSHAWYSIRAWHTACGRGGIVPKHARERTKAILKSEQSKEFTPNAVETTWANSTKFDPQRGKSANETVCIWDHLPGPGQAAPVWPPSTARRGEHGPASPRRLRRPPKKMDATQNRTAENMLSLSALRDSSSVMLTTRYGTQSQHSQHSHSTQSQRRHSMRYGTLSQHSHSTVTAQSQHTVTAQAQHAIRHTVNGGSEVI